VNCCSKGPCVKFAKSGATGSERDQSSRPTLMCDNSMLADDAAREKDLALRTTTFARALQNMKTLAEDGTLTPR